MGRRPWAYVSAASGPAEIVRQVGGVGKRVSVSEAQGAAELGTRLAEKRAVCLQVRRDAHSSGRSPSCTMRALIQHGASRASSAGERASKKCDGHCAVMGPSSRQTVQAFVGSRREFLPRHSGMATCTCTCTDYESIGTVHRSVVPPPVNTLHDW